MGSSINLSDIANKLSHQDARWQQEQLADLLGRQALSFPGAQPVSFARAHLKELQHVDYFMCEKTDGIRCLLYLTQYIAEGGVPVESQFLIDRKNDYYHIAGDSLHIPRTVEDVASYHTGTLLDGELVRQRRPGGGTKLAYLIFDMLALDGENIMHRTFDKRFGRIDVLVHKPYREFAKAWPQEIAFQPFELSAKQLEMPYGVEVMFKEKIPALPHGNDGLIFTCVTTPYVSGTDTHILKWKPPEENTIDFRLQIESFPTSEDEEGVFEDYDAKPEIHLLVFHGNGKNEYFATLSLTDGEWAALKALNQILDGRIIECFRDPTTAHWRPKVEEDGVTPRFRDDKTEANHINTVNSVLDSIKDAVTEQDLIASAEAIRAAFKQRAAAKQARDQEAMRRAKAAAAAAGKRGGKVEAPLVSQQRIKEEVPPRKPAESGGQMALDGNEDEDDGPTYED